MRKKSYIQKDKAAVHRETLLQSVHKVQINLIVAFVKKNLQKLIGSHCSKIAKLHKCK